MYLIYFIEMIFTENYLYDNKKSIAVWFVIFLDDNAYTSLSLQA